MKSSRTKPKQTVQAQRLVELAQALSESSSRLEDDFWDARLTAEVNRLLTFGKKDANSAQAVEGALTAVLEPLYQDASMAYSALVGTLESCIESKTWPSRTTSDVTEHSQTDGGQDTLLIAIPILAWSRFPIPEGEIPLPLLKEFRRLLQAHILASGVKLSLCNQLFSPDQLPQTYVATALFADHVMQAARLDEDVNLDVKDSGDNMRFLSDSRYLVAAICAPQNTAGTLLFRWQEGAGKEEFSEKDSLAKGIIKKGETPGKMSPAALSAWVDACKKPLATLLPACAFELQPVKAYHAALLHADRASRPWSINAAVAFLHALFNYAPGALLAVVARFQDDNEDEYRISLVLLESRKVVYGVTWPLLPSEDDSNSMIDITSALHAAGVAKVLPLAHVFPMEYCDDCGAALYPDAEGEAMHIEWPEDQDQGNMRHLH
jgi:hypothetical protein